MPQTKADKTFFNFSTGLVTETSPLGYPDGSTIDEENFELLIDGSRRKRRGLKELPGELFANGQNDVFTAYNSHTRVTNAGSIPGFNPIVLKIGYHLWWWDDVEDWHTTTPDMIDISPWQVGMGGLDDISENPVSYAVGRGKLFVSGPHIDTLKITWTSTTTTTVEAITPLRRWYEDIDDGIKTSERPTFATLTEEHRFNLISRGWSDGFIANFYAAPTNVAPPPAAWPAKSDIWHVGYVPDATKQYGVAAGSSDDWGRSFIGDVLFNQAFGSQSAPRGAIIVNHYNTFETESGGNAGVSLGFLHAYKGFDPYPPAGPAVPFGDPWWIPPGATLNVSGPNVVGIILASAGSVHGLSAGAVITVAGAFYSYVNNSGGWSYQYLDGDHTLLAVDTPGTDMYFEVPCPADALGQNGFVKTGSHRSPGSYYVVNSGIPASAGYITDARAACNAFYAGRLWLAGAAYEDIESYVMFSQIGVAEKDWTNMYQEGDPTSPNFNGLLPNDGGTIEVTGLSGVKEMRTLGDSLVIFAETGVWEIRGGQGFFAADDYLVRKITSANCLSASAIVEVEGSMLFGSSQGIFMISPDPQSGFLVASSLTESTIETFWKDNDRFVNINAAFTYNSIKKQVWILLDVDDDTLPLPGSTSALVLDLRLGAWSFQTFSQDTNVMAAIPTEHKTADEYTKIKFLCHDSTAVEVRACDFRDETLFEDREISEYPAYLEVAYDFLEDWQRYKQAGYVMCYMNKTETGYIAGTDEVLPVNESHLTMQTRWDWADHTNSGKYGTPQQIYRHKRLYTPADVNDGFNDGQPVVVTKNKVRGRGRSLHLYFDAPGVKPAHLLGWAIEYKGTGRI